MAEQNPHLSAQRAKQYSCIKYSLSVVELLYGLLFLILVQISGISSAVAGHLRPLVPAWGVVPLYLLILNLAYYALSFPLNYFHSFILEHRFSLSHQNLKSWCADQLKTGAISYIIGIVLAGVFYTIVQFYPVIWWILVSLIWITFSIIFTKIAPVIIVPLFFKYKKFSDPALRERITRLADAMKIKILDVFEIDFSKKSAKANAGLTGWGATKRVILTDTLLQSYTEEEVEVILAHEFAHYRLKHILKFIVLNAIATFVLAYAIFRLSGVLLTFAGVASLSDIAAFPVLMICVMLFQMIMQPLQNFLSRRMETNADLLALKVTSLKDAFISTMDKLAAQNLADRNPHPLIKFFFFDHPAIDERIGMARELKIPASTSK